MTMKIDKPLILRAYKQAQKRILFLDYDGTLVPFSDLPGDSKLGIEIRNILLKLSLDLKNHIYIISGRDRGFLTNQFKGIHAGLIAEHGFLIKEADGVWHKTASIYKTWKKTVKMLFQDFTDIYAGSFIEEKESSVAYHYRTADKDVGKKLKPVIRKQFLILQNECPGLELLDGNQVFEIKLIAINKGRTANTILRRENPDFIMAAGDDQTDEHLFAELSHNAFTIKIGAPPTRARYYITGQKKFIEFLKLF